MKELLIGSVYGPGKRTSELLQLQHLFFSRSIDRKQYTHALVVNNMSIPREHVGYGMKVVHHNQNPKGETNECHSYGLKVLLKHFLENQKKYKHFLFIDSDAWPIKRSWYETLIKEMSGKNSKDVAAVIRYENLEQRLHSSVLFCKPHALQKLKFGIAPKGSITDLQGYPECDLWVGPEYQNDSRLVLPLIRTNKVNVHPVWSGVYYDMFYHHGGGTRQCKGRSYNYYHHFMGMTNPTHRFEELKKDPCGYISDLAGWSPNEYIKFKERL